jgi:hypothetical protein
MRIATVVFDYAGEDIYAHLLDVFKYSAGKAMPSVPVDVYEIETPDHYGTCKRGFTSNTAKLEKWVEIIDNASDDILLMDCDMAILRDMGEAWKYDFDIAYTERYNAVCPMNGGVIYVRPNETTREFFRMLRDVNNAMYSDKDFHAPWLKKYAGMNQAAWGFLVECVDHGAKLLALPCVEWNCCDEDWDKINDQTRAIHVKGELRRACMRKIKGEKKNGGEYPRVLVGLNVWTSLYYEAERDGKIRSTGAGREEKQAVAEAPRNPYKVQMGRRFREIRA